jgi:REP element-mobilizing transposase RayT
MTKFNPDIHHRRSIRLRDYDYSQPGGYFVTVTTYQRTSLFGDIKEQMMLLNRSGTIVQSCWENIAEHYASIDLDAFVIMPNHIHGIIIIKNSVGAGFKPAPTQRYPLSEFIRAFKTFSARHINKIRATPGIPVWQRNYYEHVIRNERELGSIREYIENNVITWESDEENPVTS